MPNPDKDAAIIKAGTAPESDAASILSKFVDHEGEAKLDFEEFVAMQPQRIRDIHTRDELFEWYTTADESGDGKLSINEFFKWSLTRSGAGGKAILKEAFKKYDSDGGGSISSSEFKRMANDMGFGELASEAFAVLDEDDSGSISYKELLRSLDTSTPRHADTKKLLFGCIHSWGLRQAEGMPKSVISTRGWHIRSSETEGVLAELRELLLSTGAHVGDVAQIFDDDAGSAVTIDQLEFIRRLKSWGFRGMPHVLEDVFAAINTSHSGSIDYDEFFEYVRGHKHALDHRARDAMVRELTIDVPAGSVYSLGDLNWEVEPSAFEAVETLRILMQQMLVRHNVSPSDVMRAWDRSGDRQLDRRELVSNMRRLFKGHPELWRRELHRVAESAFNIIQADGVDVNATALDVIELEKWLFTPTKRRADALLPLKPKRAEVLMALQKQQASPPKPVVKAPPRPGCDMQSRANEAIDAAKLAAAIAARRKAAHARRMRRQEVRGGPPSDGRKRPEWQDWNSAVNHELPPLPSARSSPRSARSKGGAEPSSRRPVEASAAASSSSGSPRLPHLRPRLGKHSRFNQSLRDKVDGDEELPWIDEESGQLMLPQSWLESGLALTPTQLGALTCLRTRLGIT